MRKVVFLDRDGVINVEIGDYICEPAQFQLNPGIEKVLLAWQQDGYEFIVITNQGGITKGRYSHSMLESIHQKMKKLLEWQGIEILDIYYCPHHESSTLCLCRKPKSGMIKNAIARYQVDSQYSLMIGDAERDVLAAHGAGIKGYQVQSNKADEVMDIYRATKIW